MIMLTVLNYILKTIWRSPKE